MDKQPDDIQAMPPEEQEADPVAGEAALEPEPPVADAPAGEPATRPPGLYRLRPPGLRPRGVTRPRRHRRGSHNLVEPGDKTSKPRSRGPRGQR